MTPSLESAAVGSQDVDPQISSRFTALYRQHFGWLYAVVARMGVPEPHRDDVLQDTWVTVHRRLSTLDPEASERAWLFAIARRVTALHRRTTYRADRRVGALGALASDAPSTPADQAEARDILERILEQLDPPQRTVLVLSCVDGLTGPEIAETLAVPLNTVYSRLRLARRRADDELARACPQVEPQPDAQRRCWAGLVPFLAVGPDAPATAVAPASGAWLSVSVIRAFAVAAAVTAAVVVIAAGTAYSSAPETPAPPGPGPGPAVAAAAFVDDAPDHDTATVVGVEPRQPATTLVASTSSRDTSPHAHEAIESRRPTESPPPTESRRPAESPPPAESLESTVAKKLSAPSAEPEPAGSPASASTLGEESRLLEPAMAALRRGEPEAALRALARHAKLFPDGLLRDVRVATSVRAQCQRGQHAQGKSTARAFLKVRPSSVPVRRAIEACE